MRLAHVGFAVADLEAARDFYRGALQAELTEPVVDPVQKVRICFARFGGPGAGPCVELVAPAGPGSPVDGVLAKGGGCYHLCFETDDLDAAVQRLRRSGCLPVGRPSPAAAFAGRRVCFLYSAEGRLLELVEAAATAGAGSSAP